MHSIPLEKRQQALPRSMSVLQSSIMGGLSFPLEDVLGPDVPMPLLVLCGDLSMGRGVTEKLIKTLRWPGGCVDWAMACKPPPESSYSNTSWSIQAHRTDSCQQAHCNPNSSQRLLI